MEILIIGTEEQVTECRLKFGRVHVIHASERVDHAGPLLKSAHVLFDFATVVAAGQRLAYPVTAAQLFFDTSLISLADTEKQTGPWKNPVFGFCGLRTLVHRDILEVAIRKKEDEALLASVCKQLGTDYRVVADQAGMVTPRVICMIINEAYYTLEEGTATRDDIDLAMKLGTNYPYGPFEWGEKIGLGNVVKVLAAAGEETKDVRYQVCGMLMKSARENGNQK